MFFLKCAFLYLSFFPKFALIKLIDVMKRFTSILVTLLCASVLMNGQDILGKWKTDSGSAIVEVYKDGDTFNGKIVWLQNATEADGSPVLDSMNPDKSLRNRQLIGLNMLSGLKFDGKEYKGGTIYDPANGKTYNCSMKQEGNVLKVRGSLDKKGLFGRTMDWFKVK